MGKLIELAEKCVGNFEFYGGKIQVVSDFPYFSSDRSITYYARKSYIESVVMNGERVDSENDWSLYSKITSDNNVRKITTNDDIMGVKIYKPLNIFFDDGSYLTIRAVESGYQPNSFYEDFEIILPFKIVPFLPFKKYKKVNIELFFTDYIIEYSIFYNPPSSRQESRRETITEEEYDSLISTYHNNKENFSNQFTENDLNKKIENFSK